MPDQKPQDLFVIVRIRAEDVATRRFALSWVRKAIHTAGGDLPPDRVVVSDVPVDPERTTFFADQKYRPYVEARAGCYAASEYMDRMVAQHKARLGADLKETSGEGES